MTMKRTLDESVGNGDASSSSSATISQGDAKRRKCPYLDTINHQMLDFDFEKVCSVSLSDQNVYACLVCGKYFKGRGRATHAFTHSVQSAHHVFINLQNDKIYCLPDNYEVVDHCLQPIKSALRPSFEPAQIAKLDQNRILAQDAFGVSYLPGASAYTGHSAQCCTSADTLLTCLSVQASLGSTTSRTRTTSTSLSKHWRTSRRCATSSCKRQQR